MRLDVLILTQPSRRGFLQQLLTAFARQFAKHPEFLHNVQPIVRGYDPMLSLGQNREKLREMSKADYIAFFDDDDLPSPNYVARVAPLLDGVDYIGFQLRYIQLMPGRIVCNILTKNSLALGAWAQDQGGYLRDISHICPMRRDLAMRVPMEGGFGEDHRWATRLRDLKLLKTEHTIDEPLYYYFFRGVKVDPQDFRDPRRAELSGNQPFDDPQRL